MKDIKLTLYDWLGYLIPGTILIISIYFTIKDTSEFAKLNFDFGSEFIKGFIFFCLAYLLGHIIHSIANYTIDLLPYGDYAPKKYYDTEFSLDFSNGQISTIKKILKRDYDIQIADEKIKIELRNNYWLCYTNVVENKPDSLSQTFLYLNGFYRGSSVSLFLVSLTLLLKSIYLRFDTFFLIAGLFSLLFSFLLYLRAKRFKIYLTRTVYSDFISLNKLENDRT